MGFVLLLCVSVQFVLAEDFEIKSGESFASVYSSVKCVDCNFTFETGVFSEAYVKVDSPIDKLTLTGVGANDTEYKTTSTSCAFDITRSAAIRFIKIKFSSEKNHTLSYFRGADGFEIFFDECVITNISACPDKNPLLILNEKGTVRLEIRNSEIKDLRLGNFSNGGLMHLISNSSSDVVFENVKFFSISGGNVTNAVIRFSGTGGGGQVNFTKCSIDTITGIGENGFLFSSWDVYIGTSSFSRLVEMTSGCLYVSGANNVLTVVGSSFENIRFKKRGAVYFSGGSHSYTEVNMTNITNTANAATAGVVSRSTTVTTFHRCRFENLNATASTTIDQQLSGGVEITGCKFSNIEATTGRPAGIAAVTSKSAVAFYDCEFNRMKSDDSSTVAFVEYRPMIWNSVTIWNCTGGRNGAVFCLRGDLSCDNCSFSDLESDNDGGVLHHHSGTMSITRSKFQNCRADRYGGGLYAPATTYFFSNCIFLNNLAKHTNGGNDIYFNSFLVTLTLSTSKMYGCCSTSIAPRINNQKSGTLIDTYLPTCTLGEKYVGIKDGENKTGCGTSPFSPCKNLAYCGKEYLHNNPLEIRLSGESFNEFLSLEVVVRRIEATGDLSGSTLLKRAVEDVVLIDVTTGSFVGNYLNFDAAGSITVLKVRGVGQATIRDGSFFNADNISLSKSVVSVDNAGAKVIFERVVFHHIHVIDQSAIYLHCDSASFASCDFYSLSSTHDPSKSSFGGAITFVNSNTLQVLRGSFKYCNTTGYGGAVFVSNGPFSFDSVVFEQCKASAGGTVYVSSLSFGKSVRFSLCQFLDNKATTPKQGNDIRDENGTSRWSGSNMVDCCSNGPSDGENFRFSVGATALLKSNDARLPTCLLSASSCEALMEKGLCESNKSCEWENDTCSPHACASPPGEECREGCKNVGGVCVVCTPAICETTSIVNCSEYSTSDLCKDESCIWSEAKCVWNPCYPIRSESSCVNRGCTWVTKAEKCEWNKCVFMGSQNVLTEKCNPGCKRDPARICSVDICEAATKEECGELDCDWIEDTCEWHECVRMHNETACYAGCVYDGTKCKVDQCGKNKEQKECNGKDHCVWISEGSTGSSGECIWNYCEGHCEIEGCKKNEDGVCVPDDCSSVKSTEDGCPVDCVFDDDGISCKVGNCAQVESWFECYVGCFNASKSEEVCRQPDVCTRLADRCILNPCQRNNASNGGVCARGCEKDSNTSQCIPDQCIKRYYGLHDCEEKGDEECKIENTIVFGNACVHSPKAKSEQINNAKEFPWWILLVGLLVVAAIVTVLVAFIVYNWKKKKSDKPRMQIQDVADDELLKRKSDEMDEMSDASDASDFSSASGVSRGLSDASGYTNSSGASGVSGASDASGYTGSGASGYSGSGYTGSGTSGYTGASDASGYSGSAASGYSGSGYSGNSASNTAYTGYSGSNVSGSGYSGYSKSKGSARSYSNPTASGGSKSRGSKASKSKHSSAYGSESEAPSASGSGSEAPSASASGYTSASGYSSKSRKGTKSKRSVSGSKSKGSRSSSRSKSSLKSSRSKRSSAGSAAGTKSRASAGTKTKVSNSSGTKSKAGTKSRAFAVASGAEGSKTKRSSSSRHSSGSKSTRSTVSKRSNASKRSSASRRSNVSKRSTASKK